MEQKEPVDSSGDMAGYYLLMGGVAVIAAVMVVVAIFSGYG